MNPANHTTAKHIVKGFLDEHSLPYTKITSRTIHFSDLARDSCMFVKVHGWKPNPAWQDLRELARENGFCVEA